MACALRSVRARQQLGRIIDVSARTQRHQPPVQPPAHSSLPPPPATSQHTQRNTYNPTRNTAAYKGSSDLFIDSNVQLALAAAKVLAANGQRRVHVVVPDLGEYARSYKIFRPTLEALGGAVTMGHLKEASAANGGGGFDPLNAFQSLFAGGAPDPAPAGAAADLFLVTNVSCVEVPALEAYCETVAKGRPLATWCVWLPGWQQRETRGKRAG